MLAALAARVALLLRRLPGTLRVFVLVALFVLVLLTGTLSVLVELFLGLFLAGRDLLVVLVLVLGLVVNDSLPIRGGPAAPASTSRAELLQILGADAADGTLAASWPHERPRRFVRGGHMLGNASGLARRGGLPGRRHGLSGVGFFSNQPGLSERHKSTRTLSKRECTSGGGV